MRDNFSEIMRREMVFEGGKVDHPKDPGGRTNQGVTQRVYDGYRRNKRLPARDVYAMPDSERDEIYRAQYWNVVKGDDLPPGLDFVVMDGAIHSGPTQAVKWVQRALSPAYYTGAIDGHLGEGTLAAIRLYPDHDRLIESTLQRRMAFLHSLKTFDDFGNGWTKRVDHLKDVAQAWATGSVGPAPVAIALAGVKATVEDAKALPSVATGTATAAGGVSALALLNDLKDALQPFSDALQPLAGSLPAVDTLIAGVGVVSAALALTGALYAVAAKLRRAKIADALDLPVAA